MTGLFSFDHQHDQPARLLGDLLGGKGAGLAEMTSELRLDVPPGFTITLPVCRDFQASGWPVYLDRELAEHVDRLGTVMGRRLGDPSDPLLVAVRSGAPVSMPGMLDTVLNLGLNDETVLGLAAVSRDDAFAWDSYGRFVTMYATTVMGVPADRLPATPGATDEVSRAMTLRHHVGELLGCVAGLAGRPVPQDPAQQLKEAVEAVFASWSSDRARAYRRHEGIPDDLGTAVNVQAMVFGNRGRRSGTGVVFTRNPATGEATPYGDYLPRAQGEDVVAGTADTLPIADLAELHPRVHAELIGTLRTLEVHYRDICDVEFTVEDGRLWLLQTRVGKRGAVAAVRIAAELVDDPDIALTRDEALDRAPEDIRSRARDELRARCTHDGGAADLLATGLGASPGRVSGRVVLTAEEATDAEDDVILVRRETSPEDVAGMAASVGVLTTKGGLVSHAAVVARGWGIPAVVGAADLVLDGASVTSASGLRVAAGETITIDGTSGAVWRGEVAPATGPTVAVETLLPHLARLEGWAAQRSVDRAGVTA